MTGKVPTKGRPTSSNKNDLCVCGASNSDGTLVEFEKCDKWFHPSCVGQSHYSRATIKEYTNLVRETDEWAYRLTPFTCGKCMDGNTQ